MANLSNKVFIVTGAASGMGLAAAKLLVTRNASVGLCDINESGLNSLVKDLDAQAKTRVLTGIVNVSSRPSVAAFFKATRERFGKLNGFVNFAGVAGHHLRSENIWEISDDEYDHIMDANVKGAFNMLSEALKPGVLEEGFVDSKPAGSLVHVSSMFSVRGYIRGSVFTASKHAAVGLVKSAAMEAGERGIRVNAVMPGAIDTPMRQKLIDEDAPPPILFSPIERPGHPNEIASVVAFLLSDESSYVTGALWGVDGGVNA